MNEETKIAYEAAIEAIHRFEGAVFREEMKKIEPKQPIPTELKDNPKIIYSNKWFETRRA